MLRSAMVLETACRSFARETPDEADDRGLRRPQLGWVDDRAANRAPKEQRADFATRPARARNLRVPKSP